MSELFLPLLKSKDKRTICLLIATKYFCNLQSLLPYFSLTSNYLNVSMAWEVHDIPLWKQLWKSSERPELYLGNQAFFFLVIYLKCPNWHDVWGKKKKITTQNNKVNTEINYGWFTQIRISKMTELKQLIHLFDKSMSLRPGSMISTVLYLNPHNIVF